MVVTAVEITLQDPVIASLDVATAAVPTSLPYLPGGMLWGVVAARAYTPGHDPAKALALLHGGLVIGDALPVCNGSVGLPIPRCLHKPKDGGVWEDWSNGKHVEGYRQAKTQVVGPRLATTPNGELTEITVRTVTSRRTAIDPTDLRAADGQSYGLQALAAGQRFIARIEGEQTDVDAALKALEGLRILGKSRNAEFGRVKIEKASLPALPGPGQGGATILWCLSDLAAHDEHYQPTERPETLLNQPIDWSRSFVRHRSYSPFNTKWGTRQPERLVIERGSVIVVKGPVDAGFFRRGFHQEQGLGWIMATATPPLALIEAWTGKASRPGTHPRSESTLTKWLAEGVRAKAARVESARLAGGAWDEWKGRYAAAKELTGEACGPTPSQWAALAGLADAKMRPVLEELSDSTGERERRSWQAVFREGSEGTFVGAALALLNRDGTDALRRTAKSLRDSMKREGWFDVH